MDYSPETAHGHNEKGPLQSKKWTAYLIAELTWKIVLFYQIYRLMNVIEAGLVSGRQPEPSILLAILGVMMAVVIVAGFMEAVAIGGQAVLDKYVRVAAILAGKSPSEETTEEPEES